MIQSILTFAVLILTLAVIFLCVAANRQGTKIAMQSEMLDIVDRLFGEMREDQREFDRRLTELTRKLEALEKKLEKADALIDAHTEMEKEAAKLERDWQEGLNNLLNYEVMK